MNLRCSVGQQARGGPVGGAGPEGGGLAQAAGGDQLPAGANRGPAGALQGGESDARDDTRDRLRLDTGTGHLEQHTKTKQNKMNIKKI